MLRTWLSDFQVEGLIKELFPGRCFEFWLARYADDIVAMLDLMAEGVSVPPRAPLQPESMERPSENDCGGTSFVYWECSKAFPRSIKLWQHIEDVHRRTRALWACGEQVIPKNLKRHQSSESCKRARRDGL